MEAYTPYLWDLGRIAFMFAICLGLAGPLTWAERRQSAMIQDRVGPNRAGIRLFGREIRAFGLFHPIADVIKLITKEDTINIHADRFLYNLAPFIALFPALVTFSIVPFGPDILVGGEFHRLQVARMDAGILVVFAISSIAVFGVTLAGYASASKFAMLGGLRASAQMISYEVTMGLSVLGLVLLFGTLEPSAMVVAQGELIGGWLPRWGVFVQPISFIIFFTAAIAENKRIPFDMAEGESEIVGYFVEYSGMKFGMFFMAEYIEITVVAGLLTTLFFGGWQVPYLMDGVEFVNAAGTTVVGTGFHFPWGGQLYTGEWVGAGLRVGAFLLKLIFFCWLQLMLRWTLPRFRYDQVMTLGWRRLLPLSLANLVVTALVVLWT
ncbi:MAG: NADH-quinone oxidoreductase subunit H [Deltaproteobacteria bacterium]|nr:NADH-quinone oxidoreductase subunit H [Deltaproteobacteria bacterium]